MEKLLIRAVDLPGGLVLELTDASRQAAGDLWQVEVVATVRIPVDRFLASSLPGPGVGLEQLRRVLGDAVVFRKRMSRNFIRQAEKDRVLAQIMDSFVGSTLPYLSKPEFAGNVIARQYKAALDRDSRA